MKKAGNVSRDNLISFGTCFGRFSKSMQFRLHITALDFLAPYAKVKKTVYIYITKSWYLESMLISMNKFESCIF